MTSQIDRPTTLGTLVKDGVRFLVDLIDRIVNGIRDIAPAGMIVIGCQSNTLDPPMPPPPLPQDTVSVAVDAAPAPVDEGPKALGKFDMTFYYVVGEDEVGAPKKPAAPAVVAANDNQADLASIAGDVEEPANTVTLFSSNKSGGCERIAEVSKEFAGQLALQGTGKLRDGRVVNIWGQCRCEHSPCFKVTSTSWGTGGSGRALQPFRTVAVDPKVIKLGSMLYVPLLEGRRMPGRSPWGGFVHDGCLIAADVGGGIRGTQLDLFVGRKGWFLGKSGSEGHHAWARHVPVFDGSKVCGQKGRHTARKAGAI
jgi:3D (Asp-Asp-Asp) domain-containing protein